MTTTKTTQSSVILPSTPFSHSFPSRRQSIVPVVIVIVVVVVSVFVVVVSVVVVHPLPSAMYARPPSSPTQPLLPTAYVIIADDAHEKRRGETRRGR